MKYTIVTHTGTSATFETSDDIIAVVESHKGIYVNEEIYIPTSSIDYIKLEK